MGIGALAGNLTGGNSDSTTLGMNVARLAEENNRQLHPSEKLRIKDLARELAKEKGESPEFWAEQLTLVASVMNDEKENQTITNGLDVILSQSPTSGHPLHRQDWEKTKDSIGVAYQALSNEAAKNQPLTWQDGSDVVLFGEKVKMFQSTENQYKNSQMFGYMNYPSVSQYPNTHISSLDELGKLNGLTTETMKYRGELFNIIGNSHKTKQDNLGLLNAKYQQYYNGDRIEPVFWEGLVMGGGTANVLNKATNSAVNTGKTVSSQAGSYLGNFANKYPKTYETVVSGSVATGFDIYNKEESLEKTGFNFALSRLLIGKTFGTQMSVNIGAGMMLSTNDKEKSDKKIIQETTGEAVGTVTSFGIDSILSRTKIGNVSKPLISNFIGGVSKNLIKDEENEKNFGEKDEK